MDRSLRSALPPLLWSALLCVPLLLSSGCGSDDADPITSEEASSSSDALLSSLGSGPSGASSTDPNRPRSSRSNSNSDTSDTRISSSTSTSSVAGVTVVGRVRGLQEPGLRIVLNDTLEVQEVPAGSEVVVFEAELSPGDTWNLRISTQPSGPLGQQCTLLEEEGVVVAAEPIRFEVSCPFRPWELRMHQGDLSAREVEGGVALDWNAGSDEWTLWLGADPAGDLADPEGSGLERIDDAEPGLVLSHLPLGTRLHMGLARDGIIEAWTVFQRVPRLPMLANGSPGTIRAQAVDPATGVRYLGGTFAQLDVPRGYAGAVAAGGAGHVLPSPQVNARVLHVAPDGEGGWFLAGFFTEVNGTPRAYVAQVDRDGQLTDWAPQLNGTLTTLLVDEDRIYLGGRFTEVNGTPRSRLAAVDRQGALLPFDPGVGSAATPLVSTLVRDGDRILVGGNFTEVGMGSSEPDPATNVGNLAAFSPAGRVLPWPVRTDGTVERITLWEDRVYIGGTFDEVRSHDGAPWETRRNLAALSSNDELLEWKPDPDGTVNDILMSSDRIHIAGFFQQIGETGDAEAPRTGRSGYAAFAHEDGHLHPVAAHVTGRVYRIALGEDRIYLAGRFDDIRAAADASPEVRQNAAAITLDGAVLPWNPGLPDLTRTLATDGSAVMIGLFDGGGVGIGAGGGLPPAVTRGNLMAEGPDGVLLPWNPESDGTVRALLWHEDTLFVSGDPMRQIRAATSAGGALHARDGLAALDAEGAVLEWDPGVDAAGGRGPRAMAVVGDTLFIGGSFLEVGGGGTSDDTVARQRLAAISLDEGEVLPWQVAADGPVNAMVAWDDTLYLGGAFTALTEAPVETSLPQERRRLAAVSPAGTLLPWDPRPGTEVHALATDGERLYVGGAFTLVTPTGAGASARRRGLAILTREGTLAPQRYGVQGTVYAIAVDEGRIHAGGSFTGLDATDTSDTTTPPPGRRNLASFDADGDALPLRLDPNGTAWALDVHDEDLLAAGDFRWMGPDARSGLRVLLPGRAGVDREGGLR